MSRWIIALVVLILGLAAGMSYGWFLAPVEYVDTIPASLRIDFQTDYVLMVAERYQGDHDLEAARARLSIFGGEPPAEVCARAIAFAQVVPYSGEDLELLQKLKRALASAPSAPASFGTSP